MKLIANISFLFGELPFSDRFAAAADAGFDGVEALFPYDYAPEELKRLSEASGMPILQINTPRGDEAASEVGTAALPGAEERFRQGFAVALRYAEVLGCRQLHVLSGRVPHAHPGRAQAPQTLRRNLTWAAGVAEARGLTLLIEALNSRDFPDYLVPTPAAALELIHDVGRPNVKLQFDLYHSQLMGGNLTRTLERAAAELGHVQIAGVPERHEPDTGEVNYRYVLGVLLAIGYRGPISAEYWPASSTPAGLGWMQLVRGPFSLHCNDSV